MLPSRHLLCFAAIVASLAGSARPDDEQQRAQGAVIVRTLLRLPGVDLGARPGAKGALLRDLGTIRGSGTNLGVVVKFKLREVKEELLRLALEQPEGTVGVTAAGLLVKFDERELLDKAIADPDPAKASKLVSVLGLLADARTNDVLVPLMTNVDLPIAIRSAAVRVV